MVAVAVDPATLVLLTDAWLVGHLTDCNKQTNKFEKKRNPSIVVSTLGPVFVGGGRFAATAAADFFAITADN